MKDTATSGGRLPALAHRRALLAMLGVTAAAAVLGTAAHAEETPPKPNTSQKRVPKRRSISPPMAEPSARGRGDSESVPGGLPGSAPSSDSRPDSVPGGLPGARP
jgi:hypothetical protein